MTALRPRCAGLATAIAALIALLGAAAADAPPPASALGPLAPEAQPVGGYVGRLAVAPEHGPAGTPIAVTGHGLPPDQEFDLVWRTVTGHWKVEQAEYHGREYLPVGYRVARLRSDAAGRIFARFAAPEDFGFWHDVTLQQGTRLFTQAAFHLDMTVRLSPESGPPGTPIQVEVGGIGWRELQNSWLLLTDNRFTGWISAVSTPGTARFTIPASGAPGRRVIEILHGDFTFPYRNMQQSPEPDRPRFVRHFTVTPGEAVLPAPPAAQAMTSVRRLAPTGALAASPAFGTVGQAVTVRGDGFEPGARLDLQWTTVTGNRVAGSGWEESSRVIASAVADASGSVAFGFETPADLGGAHGLWVEQGGTRREGTYWITPSAGPLDVASGPAGTPFKIRLQGVGWTETANIYTVVYDNAYIGYACGFNSQGEVEIDLQATGEPGWHFIDLYPAIYKGKERRPVNFRLPQLTYAHDHPGEDLPAFRFAFRVTGEGAAAAVPLPPQSALR